ncbi:unnamed protein product [Cyprideis torosa]|uniref:Uncharacterized protein n=1 Tax=Cyprideis torosa TaxID=163714 RepID=A0A7R8ZPK4_9CRUS|nr:unnamed protein product [Cyprideis torosa]CAG0894180.1 unnamed protein product [Cyprideis torosa]
MPFPLAKDGVKPQRDECVAKGTQVCTMTGEKEDVSMLNCTMKTTNISITSQQQDSCRPTIVPVPEEPTGWQRDLVKDAWNQISLDEIKASIDQFLPRVQEVVNQQGGPIQHVMQ